MAETLLIDAKTGTPVQALRGIELPSSLLSGDFVPTRDAHRRLGLMVSFCGGNGRRRFRRDARHTVRQFPSQNGFHREAQVADQQQVRDALALPLVAILKLKDGQPSGFGDLVGGDEVHQWIRLVVLLAAISAVLGRMRHDAGYAFTVAKNCQPVLGALLFKVENVCLMVSKTPKKFVPRRTNFFLPPAPHCF